MELESSYNLLGVVGDDGIRTYRAIEIASGQELQVHLFAKADSETDRALFRALRALPVSKRRELLEIGMEGDLPYVVTEKLPEGTTARGWLVKLAGVVPKPPGAVFLAGSWKTGTPIPEELVKASHHTAPPVPPAPKKPAELSADYTRVMRVPQVLGGAPPETPLKEAAVSPASEISLKPETVFPPEPIFPPQPAPPPLPVLRPEPPAVQPPTEEQDEFTRMFGYTGSPPVTPPPVALPPVAPPPATPMAPKHEPGEFTRMFLANRAPVESATPLQPAIPAKPGEFTSQFLAPKPLDIPPAPAPPPAPVPNVAKQQPGEFTSMFLAPEPSPAATPAGPLEIEPPSAKPAPISGPAPEAAPRRPGEFTSMFLAAQPPAIEPAAPPPHLQADTPPAVQPPPVQSPSEEPTRLFQAVTPAPLPSTLAPPPKGVKEPGEFTRMFPAPEPSASPLGSGPIPGPGPDRTPKDSPDRAPKDGPSEFTRFFQSPMYPTAAGNQNMAPSTPASQPAARPPAQQSEFTQMFGNPGRPPSAPPAPLPGSGNLSSATGVFSMPKSTPAHTPVRAAGPSATGPGEFTRMMQASARPTLGQPAPPPPEPEPKAKSHVLLYVAGGAVVLAIILVIVFFILRH